jgi:hypothetical protein
VQDTIKAPLGEDLKSHVSRKIESDIMVLSTPQQHSRHSPIDLHAPPSLGSHVLYFPLLVQCNRNPPAHGLSSDQLGQEVRKGFGFRSSFKIRRFLPTRFIFMDFHGSGRRRPMGHPPPSTFIHSRPQNPRGWTLCCRQNRAGSQWPRQPAIERGLAMRPSRTFGSNGPAGSSKLRWTIQVGG